MTQLYVGNLSEDGDEKAIRQLFGRYGGVREVLMKNGYAFVEMENALQAEQSMRDLNGTDILGHPMIVEPSHQQRLSSRRRSQLGVVEVANIPTNMTLEAIEKFFSQAIGSVVKIEIEDSTPSDFGAKRILISFETMEQAQRAAALYTGEDQTLKCTIIDDFFRASLVAQKNGRSRSSPNSPSKGNTEFPLRILVPSDMVGAIIGKDGATIRGITQLTKARVDVHRRENVGSVEKAITIIGTPEACTEACYQIMKIMQNELLMTSGLLENGKHHHFEPLPVVPLKILAHNELVGRVIGKGGNTLKRIMAESGTKITISKLKDLTAYNMERTVTILGTIDNCKKAESLISAKLRASYESDMNQFMQTPVPPGVESNGSPPHSSLTTKFPQKPSLQAQSLPPTPTAVRTFTDFSQEHTRLTTLHGSTGALEVNGLGGFYPKQQQQQGGFNPGGPAGSFRTFEPAGMNGGYHHPKHTGYVYPEQDPTMHDMGNGCAEEDLNDVFTNMTIHDQYPPGPQYGQGRSRRSSAPVQHGTNLWNTDLPMGMHNGYGGYGGPPNHMQWGAPPPPTNSHSVHGSVSSIWSPTFTSPPESEGSSFPDSDGSQSFNGFSPIYSPISGNFDDAVSSTVSSSNSLVAAMTTAASSIAVKSRDPVSVVQASQGGGSMTTESKAVLAPPRTQTSSLSPSSKTTDPPITSRAFMSTYHEEEPIFFSGGGGQSSALEQLINEGISQWQVPTHT